MSEQNKGKTTSSASTIIATAIVALAAVAAIIVLIVMSKKPGDGRQDMQNNVVVESAGGQDFIDECGENAQRLVQGNYRIVRLFISEGLPYRDEPYGNRPEDRLYTVNSEEFKTFDDVMTLVKSVFVEDEANRILMRMPLDPAAAYGVGGNPEEAQLISVYWTRDEYVDASDTSAGGSGYVKQTVLGISERFKPYTDYKKPWGSTSIRIVPVNEEECDITIYLGADKDVDLSSVEDSDILTTKMVKVNGEWRLTKLVF